MGSEGAGLGEETGNLVLGVSPVRCATVTGVVVLMSQWPAVKLLSTPVALQRVTFCANIIVFLFYTYECSKVRYWHIWLLQISGFIA